jgi:hypothetical protein
MRHNNRKSLTALQQAVRAAVRFGKTLPPLPWERGLFDNWPGLKTDPDRRRREKR